MSHAVRFLVLTPVLLAIAVSGCGSDNQAEIEQARKEGAEAQKIKDKQRELEKEIARLKKQAKTTTSGGSSSNGSGGSSGSSGSSGSPCGSGVSAGPNTSCAFALNVAQAYFDAGGGSPTVSVYSPVTQKTYTMTCTAGAPTVCRGGNNASVFIR